jgi:carbonic anhydrase
MKSTLSLTRRQVIASVGLAMTGASLAAADPQTAARPYPKDAAEALARLKDGNQRFVDGKTQHAHESADWRKHLVSDQKPFATILGCSDSRVPVELVFDQGFGDLFVVRVAGNVIAPDVVGSLAYAVAHLATRLIVVMGHQGCGAVTAAVQALAEPSKEPPGIKALLELIEPGLPQNLPGGTPEQRIEAAVEANVRWSIKQLAQLPEAKKALAEKRFTLLGAVYELATGRVRYLSV